MELKIWLCCPKFRNQRLWTISRKDLWMTWYSYPFVWVLHKFRCLYENRSQDKVSKPLRFSFYCMVKCFRLQSKAFERFFFCQTKNSGVFCSGRHRTMLQWNIQSSRKYFLVELLTNIYVSKFRVCLETFFVFRITFIINSKSSTRQESHKDIKLFNEWLVIIWRWHNL